MGEPHTLRLTRLLSMTFPRQEFWSGLPFSSPGDLPNPRIEPRSPALKADSLPTELQGNPIFILYQSNKHIVYNHKGFPGGSEVKASACNVGDLGSIPGSERSPGEENGNPLQNSCLENPMDGGP